MPEEIPQDDELKALVHSVEPSGNVESVMVADEHFYILGKRRDCRHVPRARRHVEPFAAEPPSESSTTMSAGNTQGADYRVAPAKISAAAIFVSSDGRFIEIWKALMQVADKLETTAAVEAWNGTCFQGSDRPIPLEFPDLGKKTVGSFPPGRTTVVPAACVNTS